ncbi:MAG: hypothetical protein JRH16_22860 [Deltaproteobacteria bacterium]|nr:hypothetical protein [Deltaproteobacteria bacterium]MBW2363309.1 hypothetical protein [Deltaproteobacteria bacterium]
MNIDPIERTNFTLSAGAVAVSFVFSSPLFALSLALGAALEAVNFRGLRNQTQFLFWGQIQSGGQWTGVFGLRFVILIVGIGAALYFGADPAGLLIGLSLIMPAAVIEAWRTRPAIDPSAPALDADDPSWDRWNPWLAREQEEETEE